MIGILSAYLSMLRTGTGKLVDIAMYDSVMSMLEIRLSSAMGRAAGSTDTREIEVWGANPRYRCYATREGKAVTVGLLESSIWAKFCKAIGRPDLIVSEENPRRPPHLSRWKQRPLPRDSRGILRTQGPR